ncbi:DUF6773 family protein [Desulfitobacterium sp. PCE1]|uniref:DUF6773 family protein n=1 Tax=Desulfitobacterium sp. PCE1 TaxID=146907 RepID=UPI00037E44D9|nr:DUF6773 family protein [Desulfitobacterium sp. PCE1]
MKFFRKNMDERREFEVTPIANVTVYVAVFGLVAAIIVQLFVLDLNFAYIAGEFIILLVCVIYSLIGHYRRGIWDFYTKPGMKAYFAYSFVGVSILMGIPILLLYFKNQASMLDSLWIFARNFIVAFPLVFGLLALLGTFTKKRQRKLAENQYGD